MIRAALFIALLLAPARLLAADMVVAAEVEPDEIFLGESVTMTVQVKNASRDVKLDTSALEADFNVTLSGGPSQQNITRIINGRVYQENSVTWQYRLIPKKAGRLTVKGPTAISGEEQASARDMVVNVEEVPPQDLVQIEIDAPARVYRSPFDVTLRVLVKPLPDGSSRDPLSVLRDNPALQIGWVEMPEGLQAKDFREWLQPLLTSTGRGFTINNLSSQDRDDVFAMFDGPKLAVFSLYTGREIRKGLDGSDINYFVYELKRTFTPQRLGKFAFGPVTLKGTFAEKKSGAQITGKRLVLTAPTKTVEVRDVPEPRPANFIGGIGNLQVSASATPAALRVGDPLTLRLSVERKPGSGLLDLVSAPDLSLIPELADRFDIIDKAPTGEVKGETKVFNYGLRPKRAGVTMPALTFSIFDPASEAYKEVSTQPIPLTVSAATQLKTEDIVSAAPRAASNAGLKNLEGGIFQNITDLGEIGDQRVNPRLYLLGAVALAIAYLGAAFAVARQRKLAGDERFQRRQRAWPEASAAMQQAHAALGSTDRGAAPRHVRDAICNLIGNMLNVPAAGMTPKEADAALAAAGIKDDLRGRTTALLEQIDALQYSSASSGEVNALIASANDLLPQLKAALEANS
ncbi:MAG TPA: BatD family protein [Planctomycetota bacterium]|nr:BatD family protein [Planctomycetota bacterium]